MIKVNKKYKVINIILIIILSIVIEISFLNYIDEYLYMNDNVIKINKLGDLKKYDIDKISKLEISSDGRLISYFENKKIRILDVENQEQYVIPNNEYLAAHKWVPDSKRIVMINLNTNHDKLEVSYYDFKMNKGEKLYELELENSIDEIEEIKISRMSNLVYIKLLLKNQEQQFIRLGMDDPKFFSLANVDIGHVSILNKEDTLVYEDLYEQKIYEYKYFTNETKAITNVQGYRLIGIDNDDNIYIGNMQDDKINEIRIGKDSLEFSQWKQIKLYEKVNIEEVVFLNNGMIYINDKLRGSIKKLNGEKLIEYKGYYLGHTSDNLFFYNKDKIERFSIIDMEE